MGTVAITGSASGIGRRCGRPRAGRPTRGRRRPARRRGPCRPDHERGPRDAIAAVQRATGGRWTAWSRAPASVPTSRTMPHRLAQLLRRRGRAERPASPLAATTPRGGRRVVELVHAPVPRPLVAACLAGDEAEGAAARGAARGIMSYAGSKLALARWVRRNAPAPEWAGAGIRLNAVAPDRSDAAPRGRPRPPRLWRGDPRLPGPARRFRPPEQVAAAIAFLLGPGAGFCCGSVLFIDGGTDALIRPDQYLRVWAWII